MHTAHGRALAVATGAKAADPGLHVIVVMGDGDCVAIGGNHLIHAARRNIDVTALVFNNSIYGMTGGQMSPTTFEGDRSHDERLRQRRAGLRHLRAGARRRRHLRRPRHVVRLPAAWRSSSPAASLTRASRFVEAMVVCPTYYGRSERHLRPVRDAARRRRRGPCRSTSSTASGPRLHDRYPVGVLHHAERVEYTAAYADVVRRAGERSRWLSMAAGDAQATRLEIRLSGSGGQGIILAATLLADAAVATRPRGRSARRATAPRLAAAPPRPR